MTRIIIAAFKMDLIIILDYYEHHVHNNQPTFPTCKSVTIPDTHQAAYLDLYTYYAHTSIYNRSLWNIHMKNQVWNNALDLHLKSHMVEHMSPGISFIYLYLLGPKPDSSKTKPAVFVTYHSYSISYNHYNNVTCETMYGNYKFWNQDVQLKRKKWKTKHNCVMGFQKKSYWLWRLHLLSFMKICNSEFRVVWVISPICTHLCCFIFIMSTSQTRHKLACLQESIQ
jgi:hypothetical protein